ncbi:hypothetical protein PJ259_15105 [Pseudomonas sp. JBR1]|nr:hypothetical protein [Pseudomonas sp. JBR1]WCE10916.1 hypothetical protein PJ259_15105 [Pseudomonas sp. JBR1]
MIIMSVATATPSPFQRVLEWRYSTLMVWTAISLLVVETFSGFLRYALDMVGASALVYLPKIACLALFALQVATVKLPRVIWVGLFAGLAYAALALLHGGTLNNVLFSLFVYSPLLFGLVCGRELLKQRKLLGRAMFVLLIACLIGIALDKFTSVPWKGYSYNLGGNDIAGNTQWVAGEEDRIAGFARVSNVLAALIAVYCLFLAQFARSKTLWLVVALIGFFGILLTTSKAPAAAFAFTLALMMTRRFQWPTYILILLAVLGGMLLPVLSLVRDFDPLVVMSDSGLASFYDRLVNTWPNVVAEMTRHGWTLEGAGFGLFGSSMAAFPIPGIDLFVTSDSSVVYLWCVFGVVGILGYAMQLPVFIRLHTNPDRLSHTLLAIAFCLCLIGWTTDLFDIGVGNLFVGIILGYVLMRDPEDDGQQHLRPVSGRTLGD